MRRKPIGGQMIRCGLPTRDTKEKIPLILPCGQENFAEPAF